MAVAATGIPAESGEPAMGKPRMKGRHLVMMSLGSAIGTGLFVGSGKGVAAAGPATLVAYIVAGLLVIAIMYMLGEMVAAHPDSGAFSVYTSRAMGSAAGFAMGWVWWIELVVVVAAEAIAAASTLVAMWPSPCLAAYPHLPGRPHRNQPAGSRQIRRVRVLVCPA